MAKWVHADVLDNGLNYIKNNCDKVAAITTYIAGDVFATVMATGNIVGEAAMTSTDFTVDDGTSSARKITTVAGKQDTSANNTADPTHFAFVDTVNSKVLWVTSENTTQTVTSGNTLTFPSLVHTSNQPT